MIFGATGMAVLWVNRLNGSIECLKRCAYLLFGVSQMRTSVGPLTSELISKKRRETGVSTRGPVPPPGRRERLSDQNVLRHVKLEVTERKGSFVDGKRITGTTSSRSMSSFLVRTRSGSNP